MVATANDVKTWSVDVTHLKFQFSVFIFKFLFFVINIINLFLKKQISQEGVYLVDTGSTGMR